MQQPARHRPAHGVVAETVAPAEFFAEENAGRIIAAVKAEQPAGVA